MEYGAIDLHTKESQIRIVTETGALVVEQRIRTTHERLAALFGGRAPMRVLLESGTESEWVAQQLERLGHQVVVADPNYLPMYGTRTRRVKTDHRDVTALAEANRLGHFRPAHRVSSAQRTVRRQLQTRATLIQMRTQTINVLRTQLRGAGHRVGTGTAETLARRVRTLDLPPALLASVTPLLAALDALAPLIDTTTAVVTAHARQDAVTCRLMTAPGVGPITALYFRATIDDVGRFADAGAVSAYLGLVPREMSSGERQHQGHITKVGPKEPRAVLVQAAWGVWRSTAARAVALRTWVQRLATRRGKRIAIVALARRLARILFAMWRDGRDFQAPAPVSLPTAA